MLDRYRASARSHALVEHERPQARCLDRPGRPLDLGLGPHEHAELLRREPIADELLDPLRDRLDLGLLVVEHADAAARR